MAANAATTETFSKLSKINTVNEASLVTEVEKVDINVLKRWIKEGKENQNLEAVLDILKKERSKQSVIQKIQALAAPQAAAPQAAAPQASEDIRESIKNALKAIASIDVGASEVQNYNTTVIENFVKFTLRTRAIFAYLFIYNVFGLENVNASCNGLKADIDRLNENFNAVNSKNAELQAKNAELQAQLDARSVAQSSKNAIIEAYERKSKSYNSLVRNIIKDETATSLIKEQPIDMSDDNLKALKDKIVEIIGDIDKLKKYVAVSSSMHQKVGEITNAFEP